MTDLVRAPWTTEQVQALNDFQEHGKMHPLTCGAIHASGRSPVLDATHSGWICPDPECTYTQDWAHAFMTQPAARTAAVVEAERVCALPNWADCSCNHLTGCEHPRPSRTAARQTTPVGPCGCGAPATPNVIHRQGAPCYMDQDGGLQTVELPTATARQTTGQDDTWPLATPCGYCAHTLNWHVTGGRCRVTGGENGCGCTTFVAPDGSHPDHPHHAPAVGQPAEAHSTDTSTWWTIQAQKPTGTWFNLSEGFSSADEARAWRDTEVTEPRNWPLRIVRVDQTETVAVEGER